MYTDTINFVNSCQTCISQKPHRIQQAPFQNSPIPSLPAQSISMDLLGPLQNGMYILTIVDMFSRYLELYPLTRITSEAVTDCLFSYICRHGRPSTILTDLGRQFSSCIFENLNKALGIQLNHTTPAHPQANGISERLNASVKSTINCLLAKNLPFKYCVWIHQHMYNASVHRSTEFSPNLLHFARETSLIFDCFSNLRITPLLDKPLYLENLFETMQVIHGAAFDNLVEKRLVQNSNQHSKAKLRKFLPGQIVYISPNNIFSKKFVGPFEILKQHSDVTYSIRVLNNSAAPVFKIHADRLYLATKRKEHLVDEQVLTEPTTSSAPLSEPRYWLRSHERT